MKYIRTKDGHIYEIEIKEFGYGRKGYFKSADDNFNLRNGLVEWQLDSKTGFYLEAPNGYTVCEKQADTIPELCDGFVVKIKTGYLITYYDKKLLTQDANKNGADVYGAIWTDKGLIFEAKLKGVLPNGEIDWELL